MFRKDNEPAVVIDMLLRYAALSGGGPASLLARGVQRALTGWGKSRYTSSIQHSNFA